MAEKEFGYGLGWIGLFRNYRVLDTIPFHSVDAGATEGICKNLTAATVGLRSTTFHTGFAYDHG